MSDAPPVNPPASPPADPPATPPADPPATPPAVPPVPPVTDPPAHADTSTRVGRLEDLVTSLTETVARLIPSDDKPTRRPWTHAGSKRRDG